MNPTHSNTFIVSTATLDLYASIFRDEKREWKRNREEKKQNTSAHAHTLWHQSSCPVSNKENEQLSSNEAKIWLSNERIQTKHETNEKKTAAAAKKKSSTFDKTDERTPENETDEKVEEEIERERTRQRIRRL